MPSLTKRCEIMVTTTRRKNLGPPMLKHNDDTHVFRKTNRHKQHFCVSCQIDVVNKQLFSPIS